MNAAPLQEPRQVRSRTRIGSDDARSWVRKLRLGNPFAKAILMAIANYMNEDGAAWPGLATLAQDTDIAEETISKRLRWCESIGAIALLKCWIDENGRRNLDNRCHGRPTSHEIRFLFDADPEEIAANAEASSEPRPLRGAALASHQESVSARPCGEQTDEIRPRPCGEQNPVSPRLVPEQPSPVATRTIELESKKDSPLPPKGGLSEVELEEQVSEASEPEGWTDFKTEFEKDGVPILRVSIAMQLFGALSWPDERKQVTRAAKGLIIQRSREKKPGVKPSAQTLIREPGSWPSYAQLVPPDPPPPKPKITIATGNPEFLALCLARAIARRPAFTPHTVSTTFIGDIPAGAAGLASLVRFKPGTFEVDQSGWTIAAKGSPRYVAWCERLKEWLGFWPEEHRYWLDKDDNIVANSTLAERRPNGLPKALDGLLMPPFDWPPPKGSTGPPPQLSEEDAREFTK